MKLVRVAAASGWLLAWGCCHASTLAVVPVYEPLSLQGTDCDDAISDTGDTLQACVMSRPMALTGAVPEVLVDAIRSPHRIPSNHPHYRVEESNLLVLCHIGINGTVAADGLTVRVNVAQLVIPVPVDLTARQIIKLTVAAVRRTLDEYQRTQTQSLAVTLVIEGTGEANAGLRDLGSHFILGAASPPK